MRSIFAAVAYVLALLSMSRVEDACAFSSLMIVMMPRRISSKHFNDNGSTLSWRLAEWDCEISDEDAAMLKLIRGPAGDNNNKGQQERRRPKSILILSDATGVTAKSSVE